MDTQHFDRIAGSFAESRTRRGALRALAAAAFGIGGVALLTDDESAAKKKRNKKKGGKGKAKAKVAATGAGARIAAAGRSASATPIRHPAARPPRATSAAASGRSRGITSA